MESYYTLRLIHLRHMADLALSALQNSPCRQCHRTNVVSLLHLFPGLLCCGHHVVDSRRKREDSMTCFECAKEIEQYPCACGYIPKGPTGQKWIIQHCMRAGCSSAIRV